MASGGEMRYDGQVAIVTGAGRGLGREYAKLLASRGCAVVVNDVGTSADRTWSTGKLAEGAKVADECVAEIRAAGGEATANYDDVNDGEAIVRTALDAYGRVDVVVNNAGIVTPEVFSELTLESWQRTLDVNTTGVFSLMKAAWPVLTQQKYGRVVCVASPAIFGAGVAAYAASKTGVIGLANSLQFEARKLKADIKVNVLIPQAMTRMTNDLNDAFDERKRAQGKKPAAKPAAGPSPEILNLMGPDKVSAMVAFLSHKDCSLEATVHEAGSGYFAQLRWARSAPLFATAREGVVGAPTPEHIRDGQATLNDWAGGDMPVSGDGAMGAPSGLQRVMGHLRGSKL